MKFMLLIMCEVRHESTIYKQVPLISRCTKLFLGNFCFSLIDSFFLWQDLKYIPENFLEVQHTDPRLKNVKAVLVTPPDSRSGLLNPVEFIMKEGEG